MYCNTRIKTGLQLLAIRLDKQCYRALGWAENKIAGRLTPSGLTHVPAHEQLLRMKFSIFFKPTWKPSRKGQEREPEGISVACVNQIARTQ